MGARPPEGRRSHKRKALRDTPTAFEATRVERLTTLREQFYASLTIDQRQMLSDLAVAGNASLDKPLTQLVTLLTVELLVALESN